MILLVSGPQYCNYREWVECADERGTYTSRYFFEWVFGGLAFTVLQMFGPACYDLVKKNERPRTVESPREVDWRLSVLMPYDFPLATDVRLYFETRQICPRFPHISLTYWGEGDPGPEARGLWLEPDGCPYPGVIPQDRMAASRWVYWPQKYWRKGAVNR